METKRPFRVARSSSGDLELGPSNKEFVEENCKILLSYLEERKEALFSVQDFEKVRELFDLCYLYIMKVKGFEDRLLSLRLGGNILPEWLKENPDFKTFIQVNYLHHTIFALRFILPFDQKLGAGLPIEENGQTRFVFWKESRPFKIDENGRFLPGYAFLYKGICAYNIYTDPQWRPFQKLDPKGWGNKYMLEVWTVSLPGQKPPMFRRTHAYVVLKDIQGNVRSVGQDVLVSRKDYRVTEILNRKPGFGKIVTPDPYVFYPKYARRFWKSTFEITKEEHDRIVDIVEKDKQNKEHSMSVLKGNCVSYVLKILREGIGVEIDASMHGLHIILKALLPDLMYRKFFYRFTPWYAKQNRLIQRGVFFIPFVYIPHLFVGIAALFTRQNNYQEIKDFSLTDLIIRPWSLSGHHPLALHRRLEEVKDFLPQLRRLYFHNKI